MRNITRLLTVAVLPVLLLLATAPCARCEDLPKAAIPAAQASPSKAETSPAATSPAQLASPVKIGYVDMAKIAESTPGKAALAEVKQRAEQYRSRIATRQKQLEKQKAAIQAKIESLSPQERATKSKEFQKKVEEFQKFVEGAEKEMRGKEATLLEKLYSAVELAAGDYGKANGFAVITFKKELLYLGSAVDARDVTDEVMKLVNGKPGVK